MNINKVFTRKFTTVCFFTFIISFGLTAFIFNYEGTGSEQELTRWSSSGERIHETEVALIFFGCSTCPAATDEDLPSLLKDLSSMIKEISRENEYGFTFIGLSNERQVEQGLQYLNNLASFDEISLGNGMGNMGLQHYVWDNFSHQLSASTPQIIISKRIFDTVETGEREVVHQDSIRRYSHQKNWFGENRAAFNG